MTAGQVGSNSRHVFGEDRNRGSMFYLVKSRLTAKPELTLKCTVCNERRRKRRVKQLPNEQRSGVHKQFVDNLQLEKRIVVKSSVIIFDALSFSNGEVHEVWL